MPPRTPWPRRAPTIGKSRQRPVNLTGFIPLVDLTGDPVSFPFGATLNERYRSMRARGWWRMAINAIRSMLTLPAATRRRIARISLGLPSNHPSSAWKQAVPRPPPVTSAEDDYMTRYGDEPGPAWSDFFRRRPGAWGRNFGRYSDAQDVIGFYPHPYRRPTEDDEDFWPYRRTRQ